MLRGIVSSPWRMILLALGGVVLQFWLFTPVVLLVRTGFPMRLQLAAVMFLVLLSLHCVTQFLLGRWLVRWTPGRELSLCLALGVLNAVAGLRGLHNVSINIACWQIPVIAGAVSGRIRYLRQA
jgi:hypothetical protein